MPSFASGTRPLGRWLQTWSPSPAWARLLRRPSPQKLRCGLTLTVTSIAKRLAGSRHAHHSSWIGFRLLLFIETCPLTFIFQVAADIKPNSARPVILTKNFKSTVIEERPTSAPAPQVDLAREERLLRQQDKQKQWQARRQDTDMAALDQDMDYEQILISTTTRYAWLKRKL